MADKPQDYAQNLADFPAQPLSPTPQPDPTPDGFMLKALDNIRQRIEDERKELADDMTNRVRFIECVHNLAALHAEEAALCQELGWDLPGTKILEIGGDG